jgi:hypothetical protein
MTLRVAPIELRVLNAFVADHHRHHKPVQGHRFSLGAFKHGRLVGVCSVGRPVARMTDASAVVEITRLATDGTRNACSVLYAAAARAAREMGYQRAQTFILASEPGTSLRAAGWTLDGRSAGGSWNRPSRDGRREDQPQEAKLRWVKTLNPPLPVPEMHAGPICCDQRVDQTEKTDISPYDPRPATGDADVTIDADMISAVLADHRERRACPEHDRCSVQSVRAGCLCATTVAAMELLEELLSPGAAGYGAAIAARDAAIRDLAHWSREAGRWQGIAEGLEIERDRLRAEVASPRQFRLRALAALGYRRVPEGHVVVPREAPSEQEIRLHLGEVSAQGMRDIRAYHRWLATANPD